MKFVVILLVLAFSSVMADCPPCNPQAGCPSNCCCYCLFGLQQLVPPIQPVQPEIAGCPVCPLVKCANPGPLPSNCPAAQHCNATQLASWVPMLAYDQIPDS